MRYALIGKKLGHSYSATIHNSLGASYDLVELSEEELSSFMQNPSYDGFNVTVPYKKAVIPYLDELSQTATLAGAVNTVKVKDGKSYGYNTDVRGMDYMIERTGLTLKDKVVMVLGSGGTSGTARALCKLKGAKDVVVVSRSGEVNYDNCPRKGVNVIINATPVGMYPDVANSPIDLNGFDDLEGVFDCVYNPKNTSLISSAKKLGIVASSGLSMLVAQAVKAEEIWREVSLSDKIEAIIADIDRRKVNVILEGMPSSGKTTVGKAVAEILSRQFLDVDEEIKRRTNRSPAEIITRDGEPRFRDIESEVVKDLAKESGKVIALGGGSVLREENVFACRQNGVIFYLKRPLSLLSSEDRPLSQREGVKALYEKRRGIYESAADHIVDSLDILSTAEEIVEIFNRSFN